MKFLIMLLLIVASATHADVVTATTAGTSVAFTNDQSNFVWSPTALIYSRDQADPVSLHIYRYGNGTPVLLASITATASNLIWIPPGLFIFPYQSSLVVSSSVANFSVQLHREAADD